MNLAIGTSALGEPSGCTPLELEQLRRRGTHLIAASFWFAAMVVIVVSVSYYISAVESLLGLAEGWRGVFGVRRPPGGPDWYLLLWIAAAIAIPALVLAVARSWYLRLWKRRLKETWRGCPPAGRSRHSRLRPLVLKAGPGERRRRLAYLIAILSSPSWTAAWKTAQAASPPGRLPSEPIFLRPEEYEHTAEAVLAAIEPEVAERAVTVGLAVGLSRNRFLDAFAIVAAALELQLFVLTRLGKRPGWWTWREMAKRSAASLFVNTYLNRQDALATSLLIKKAGMGLEMAADFADDVGDFIDDIDLDEFLGDALGENAISAALKGLVNLGGASGHMVFTVGATGIRTIAAVIEEVGNDLLQGVLAGSVLYHHGMALAAEVLALDREHRESAEMNRSVPQGMRLLAHTTGALLRDHVRAWRRALRERRRRMLDVVARHPTRLFRPDQAADIAEQSR